MKSTIHQAINDSEDNFTNTTFWHIQPYFQLIRNGETDKLMESIDIQMEKTDFHDRVSKDQFKQMEYMTVSLINTFMIAAIQGGLYPPEANWIADQALRKLTQIKNNAEINPLIKEYAFLFCEKVKMTKMEYTGNPHVEKAGQYMKTHITQPITIDDITAHTDISKYHLSHLFKQYTGKTIREYLIELRIRTAEELLETTNKSISEIASLLQFCDQSYFTYRFRKITGMTPNAYRKKKATL
ncbi:MAG: helix-turn-helix transcriptional regulator [Solobacterium sp.]|nr:helix-turn-helix transcriptional regulator [Solobacterium sp.]